MSDQAELGVADVRAVLMGEHPKLAAQRRSFGRFPSEPRCRMCAAPFAGIGGVMFRPMGYGRSRGNPSICAKCVTQLRSFGVSGVEIPVSLLFADVRGSTAMGERLSPSAFHAFLDHFYRLASDAITSHDGLVDKVVGDEVIGLFFGGISGPDHSAAALGAALDLAQRAARPDATPVGPVPAGTAVHTGTAFVGATGPQGTVDDFTALGDPVNTTARLASAAAAGEVIVSVAAATAAHLDGEGVEGRTIEVRGRQAPVDVFVLRPGAP